MCSAEPLLRNRRWSEIKYLGCIWHKSVILNSEMISSRFYDAREQVLLTFLQYKVFIFQHASASRLLIVEILRVTASSENNDIFSSIQYKSVI